MPELNQKMRKEEASPILLNAICAISARYSPKHALETPNEGGLLGTSWTSNQASRAAAYSGDVFAQKAKSQALKVLAVSDLDVCAALLILSWNEFGCDRDAVSLSENPDRMTADDNLSSRVYGCKPSSQRFELN